MRNQFSCGTDSWRHRFHVKKLKISELLFSYVVCGVRTSMGHSRIDSILVPTRFQESMFLPITRTKLPVQDSGQIFKDDVNGFTSTHDICFIAITSRLSTVYLNKLCISKPTDRFLVRCTVVHESEQETKMCKICSMCKGAYMGSVLQSSCGQSCWLWHVCGRRHVANAS